MKQAKRRLVLIISLIAGIFAVDSHTQNISLRPGREFRSLNTSDYEIAIQRNGRVDVALSSGEPVFTNVFPMVWFEGEDKPERLTVDGRYSARIDVNDRLGRGQGMSLRKKNCEWHLRAYPTQPFFVVQVAFINTKKRAVSVRALMPWCLGEPKRGEMRLGRGTQSASFLEYSSDEAPRLRSGNTIRSERQILAHNTANGRSLLLGFLTRRRGNAEFRIERSAKAEPDAYDFLRAICVFDPPVIVEPGQKIESDVLYIAVAENDPRESLKRFARATGAAQGDPSDVPLPPTIR